LASFTPLNAFWKLAWPAADSRGLGVDDLAPTLDRLRQAQAKVIARL
jgi:hypothetical protein